MAYHVYLPTCSVHIHCLSSWLTEQTLHQCKTTSPRTAPSGHESPPPLANSRTTAAIVIPPTLVSPDWINLMLNSPSLFFLYQNQKLFLPHFLLQILSSFFSSRQLSTFAAWNSFLHPGLLLKPTQIGFPSTLRLLCRSCQLTLCIAEL